MIPAVGGNFVPCPGDLAHDLGMALGHPAEDEKGGSGAMSCQQLEHPRDAPRDSALSPLPGCARNDGLERGDLEVLLDIHREVVRCDGREGVQAARPEWLAQHAADRLGPGFTISSSHAARLGLATLSPAPDGLAYELAVTC